MKPYFETINNLITFVAKDQNSNNYLPDDVF